MTTHPPCRRPLKIWASPPLFYACIIAALAFTAQAHEQLPVPPGSIFTADEAKQYLQFQERITQSKTDYFAALQKAYPGQKQYNAYQIMAVITPKISEPVPPLANGTQKGSGPKNSLSPQEAQRQLDLAERSKLGEEKMWNDLKTKYGKQDWYQLSQVNEFIHPSKPKSDPKPVQKGTPPAGAVSAEQAYNMMAAAEAANLDNHKLWSDFQKNYGKQDYYLPNQVGAGEDNPGKPPSTLIFRANPSLVDDARRNEITTGWRTDGLLIRQSWQDVLAEEDPSLGMGAKKTLADLTGATASYTHDGKKSTNSWSVVGAAILPFHYVPPGSNNSMWVPDELAIAPSASIDKVDGSDPKTNIDTVVYRLGTYFDWDFTTGRTVNALGAQLRAAGVYATDTSGHARLPGYEADLEPRIRFTEKLSLGYNNVVIKSAPFQKDNSDNAWMAYQLRAWLHLEGGDVQDSGTSWDPTHGSFQRLGPSVQFQLNFPALGFLGERAASLTAQYTHLSALSGSDLHDSYLKATASFDLLKNATPNHKVTFNVTYQKGGLSFTKQDVDLLTVGMGVLF